MSDQIDVEKVNVKHLETEEHVVLHILIEANH
jgi:hypothetical protein